MAGAEIPENTERAAAVAVDHQHSRGNVTFDPLTRAIPAANPEIKEVLDFGTGEFIDTENYIAGMRYEELIAARLVIRDRLGPTMSIKAKVDKAPSR